MALFAHDSRRGAQKGSGRAPAPGGSASALERATLLPNMAHKGREQPLCGKVIRAQRVSGLISDHSEATTVIIAEACPKALSTATSLGVEKQGAHA